MKNRGSRQGLVTQLLFLGLAGAQWTEPPPTTADPDTIADCTWWHEASASDTCASVAALYGLAEEQLISYNPILEDSCAFISGNSYCIEQNWGLPTDPPDTSTSPTSPSETSPSPPTNTDENGISTPSPIQPGMVSGCNKFHFVEDGSSCDDITVEYGISLSDLISWNPTIKDTCTGLWANAYVCVGTVDGPAPDPTLTPTATPTDPPGNGIATPTPIQPGMVDNCNKFDFVDQGEVCQQVVDRNGISLEDFYTWNPDVGSTCAGLWADVYVCVSIIGSSDPAPTPTTLTTTTRPGNGVATPTPIQDGMVTNCDEFHEVIAGDTCYDIAVDAGISLADFYDWNEAMGSDCAGLWEGYYVCTSLI